MALTLLCRASDNLIATKMIIMTVQGRGNPTHYKFAFFILLFGYTTYVFRPILPILQGVSRADTLVAIFKYPFSTLCASDILLLVQV